VSSRPAGRRFGRSLGLLADRGWLRGAFFAVLAVCTLVTRAPLVPPPVYPLSTVLKTRATAPETSDQTNPNNRNHHSRTFVDAVLLPNGKILVCNGAQRGVPGGTIDGGSTAKDAAFTAFIYDPEKAPGSRITPLASSNIHRYYHSTAMLLPSGDIWVGGSEQGECSGVAAGVLGGRRGAVCEHPGRA